MKTLCAPPVLVVTASPQDERFFSDAAEECHWKWKLTISSSLSSAMELAGSRKFQVVAFDRDLPDQQWRTVITNMKAASPRSCFLLISAVNDDYLWREVLRCGGYDVIPRPLEAETVNRIFEQAWHYCNAVPPDFTP
jgi:DNA-binding NtrC family response regulator